MYLKNKEHLVFIYLLIAKKTPTKFTYWMTNSKILFKNIWCQVRSILTIWLNLRNINLILNSQNCQAKKIMFPSNSFPLYYYYKKY